MSTLQRAARGAVTGAIVGAVALGSALAGVVVMTPGSAPQAPDAGAIAAAAGVPLTVPASSAIRLEPRDVGEAAGADVVAPKGGRTPEGTFLAGAATVSLEPAPTLFGGERWQTEGCTTVHADEDLPDSHIDADHVVPSPESIRGWPAASPDCVYLGGFGIGPVRPAEGVGRGGVWVRALAISNGERTFVYEVADLVGWFARYDPTICADCGVRDVRERLAADLGIGVGDVVVTSTHSHATADTYGGWGGIPGWYRDQIRDSAVAAAKQAVANLRPARLASGEVHLRNRNNERRDHYYSTVDTGATWIQAETLPTTEEICETKPAPKPKDGKESRPPKPKCRTEEVPAAVIATMTTYAAHPTIVGDNLLHADWPGAAARAFEETYGGVGLVFEGGLGNASVRGLGGDSDEDRAEATGRAIAADVAATISEEGGRVASNDLASSVRDITHPAGTNPGLITLATVGLFDREFIPGTKGAGPPGAYHWSKAGELSTEGETPDADPGALRGCTTLGPTVITTAGAHRIGDVLVAFTPGEIFSNIAEVIKERADRSRVAVVLGQANDALGYVIQSFEFDAAGNVVTEYGTQTGEYEEVFAIDRCFGDHVLSTVLGATAALGFGG